MHFTQRAGVGDGDGGGGGYRVEGGEEVTASPVSFQPRYSNKNRRETIIMVIAYSIRL